MMSASLAAPRHASYHQRHAYEMMGVLRDLRFSVVQAQKRLTHDRVSSGNTMPIGFQSMAREQDARALSNARWNLENAISALYEKDYHRVYPYLDRAAGELELTPYDSLGDSIREWRERWLPNKGLNSGRS